MSSYSPPFRLRFPRTAIAYLDGAPVEIVTIDYLRELGNEQTHRPCIALAGLTLEQVRAQMMCGGRVARGWCQRA